MCSRVMGMAPTQWSPTLLASGTSFIADRVSGVAQVSRPPSLAVDWRWGRRQEVELRQAWLEVRS